jgi:CheY-like chemotaxis protein
MNLSEATLLIVEDEPDLLEVTWEGLSPFAAKVLTAKDGSLALKVLESAKVDAIVTDVRMPVMDGVALLKNVRSASPEKPAVIIVTGYSDLTSREAFDLGADALLAKPVRRKEMIEALERALQGKKELWDLPYPGADSAAMHRDFPSLFEAIASGEVAFGRGGFRLRTTQELPRAVIALQLNFLAERKSLSGQGIVRWEYPREQSVGIEILSLTGNCVDWVFALTASGRRRAFIPAHPAQTSS